MSLDRRDDADREVLLTDRCPYERSDRAGRDAGEFAEELAVIEKVGPEAFRYGQHHLAVGTSASGTSSSQILQIAKLFVQG